MWKNYFVCLNFDVRGTDKILLTTNISRFTVTGYILAPPLNSHLSVTAMNSWPLGDCCIKVLVCMSLPLYNRYRFCLPSWAASVAQLVKHVHGMQFITGLSPTLGSFSERWEDPSSLILSVCYSPIPLLPFYFHPLLLPMMPTSLYVHQQASFLPPSLQVTWRTTIYVLSTSTLAQETANGSPLQIHTGQYTHCVRGERIPLLLFCHPVTHPSLSSLSVPTLLYWQWCQPLPHSIILVSLPTGTKTTS